MKIGMPTLYEFNTIKENVDLAKSLNLDFVEMNVNFDYVREELEKTEELVSLFENTNLCITLHFFDDFDFFAPDEIVNAYLKLFDKYVNLASYLDLKVVNVHLNPGVYTTINGTKKYNFEKDYKEQYKKMIRILTKMENVCKKRNCILSLENTVMPKGVVKLFTSLNKDGFNFTYDVGHDFMDKERMLANTKKLPRFVEFHLHDADKKSDHLEIGTGKIYLKPFKDLAMSLNSYVLIEVKEKEALLASVKKFCEL